MNRKIPKKVESLFTPIITELINGKYLIIQGSAKDDGWYPIDESFDITAYRKNWTMRSLTKQVVKVESIAKTYEIANSKNNGFYTIKVKDNTYSCNCTGFGFRNKCKHVDIVKQKEKV